MSRWSARIISSRPSEMWRCGILLWFAITPSLTFAQPQLQFPASPYPPLKIVKVLPLSGGTSFAGTSSLGLTLWNGRGFTKLGGSGIDTPNDALADPSGNIWITGTTTSGDFPCSTRSF